MYFMYYTQQPHYTLASAVMLGGEQHEEHDDI